MDAWLACQAAWQYLEPIFSSPDIMAQMPEAGEKFGMVDASWREIMDQASNDPSALSAGKSRERLDALNEANQLLDEIQKSALACNSWFTHGVSDVHKHACQYMSVNTWIFLPSVVWTSLHADLSCLICNF
jgi:hypothetical protein